MFINVFCNNIFLLLIIVTRESYIVSAFEHVSYPEIYDSFFKVFTGLKRLFVLPFKNMFKINISVDKLMKVAGDIKSREEDSPRVSRRFDEDFIRLPEIIRSNGHKVEIHTVLTSDGFHLSMFRILPTGDYLDAKIALLHHGLYGSSDDWILLGPNALPFLLSKSGYDVWLANARGNRYSRANTGVHMNPASCWNHTFHEIGNVDLAEMVDYIRKATLNVSQINFIGHSMGATALLVLLTTQPKYTYVFRCAFFLAPLVFMYTVRGPMRLLAEKMQQNGNTALDFLGKNELLGFPDSMIRDHCRGDKTLCANPLLFLAGSVGNIRNETFKKVIVSNAFGGGSTKTLVHYCQLVNSGQFRMFDFGVAGNVKVYGMRSPPAYSLSDVMTPVGLFVATDDCLCTTTDAWSLMATLPNVVFNRVISRKGFTHTDFLWGKDAPRLVYYVLLQAMEDIETTVKRKYDVTML